MLRLITGKAGTGKTSAVNSEIRQAVQECRGGIILIVPEQFSHEAERELCAICGDTLSRYAEVLSFTGLARKAASVLGGIAVPYLDEGGRSLCMAQAMKPIGTRLSVFQNASAKPDLQKMLLSALDSMKTACITPRKLLNASLECGGDLGRKLSDLALISESYTAVLGSSAADPSDTLSALAAGIEAGFLTEKNTVYVDGFSDFTKAELFVLRAILRQGVSLTVCLTLDDLNGKNEIFSLPRSSAFQLLSFAREFGEESAVTSVEGSDADDPLRLFPDHVFSYTKKTFPSGGKIELFRAENMQGECEAAAAKAIELVRDHGFRWHDIAIAVRGFADYAALLENTFEDYSIPLFTARRAPVTSRPLFVFLSCVFSILLNGWRADDILSYLGTGLTGLTLDECDLLSSYITLWQPDERSWKSGKSWRQLPDGSGGSPDDAAQQQLEKINALRRKVSEPLLHLSKSFPRSSKASSYTRALAVFLDETEIAERLEARCAALEKAGRRAEAEETGQLWNIVVSAIEQTHMILGESELDAEAFSRLFLLTLSRYDIGSIPASLDAVTAGDFDRMRRRHIRVLIILGADDARLPAAETETGIFSDEELARLSETEAAFREKPENEMWREYLRIYNCLSLPSDRLILFCSALDADGNKTSPSTVIDAAMRLFSLELRPVSPGESALAAPGPALRLAASEEGPAGAAAAQFFRAAYPGKLEALKEAAIQLRGSLSPGSTYALYGKKIRISASRAEKFFSCRYAYFCEFGLRAHPQRRAVFSASELGSFTHFVLQRTAEGIDRLGGFHKADEAVVRELAEEAVSAYIRDVLSNFEEKTERFVYLFRRAAADVVLVASDMAEELKRSRFVPLAFELDFGNWNTPLRLSLNGGKDVLTVSGIADRIDGCEIDGKAYLRVFDYKTGNKKFSFSDIWYGMSMQLLLYLYALQQKPEEACEALGLPPGTPLLPAGAVYSPARSRYLSVNASAQEQEIAELRRKEFRRSGFTLEDSNIPDAWEAGPDRIYSPFQTDKSGNPSGDTLLTGRQFDLLFGHMIRMLADMAEELRNGSIEANPFEKGNSGEMPCRYCDYSEACNFVNGENGEKSRVLYDLKAGDVLQRIEEEDENGRI